MPRFVLSAAEAVARAQQSNLGYLAPLRPVLIGPRAGLHRFAVEDERALLGAYDKLADQTYDYTDKAADSTVDLASVKLFASTADLNYFNKYVGVGGSCQPPTTHPNRVRAAGYVFKTANGTARSADFYDRDVAVGDIVYVRGLDGGNPVELTTTVTGFVGDAVASTRSSATADAANAANQSASSAISQVAGTPINDVTAAVSHAAYESTADGYINRTYTITVTQSSTGNDATTALLRVRSSDGYDDHDDVVPAAFGAPTAIGAYGLTVTFDINPSQSSSSLYGIDEDDLVVGQSWTATVSQAFTAPTATAAGTYTGAQDTTYVVTVSTGGLFAGAVKPAITVTLTTGYDQSGPTDVTAGATPFAVGNYGVTIAFSGTYLRKGDKYYITVTAEAEGAVRTLILRDDVAAAIRGTEVDLRLFARRTDLEIAKIRTVPTTAVLWSCDADGVTVESGISVTDSEFTDGGDPIAVVMDSATLYVEYREWLTDGAAYRVEVASLDAVEPALGTVAAANPLAFAASKALANTAGELAGDPTRPAATTTDRVYCVAIGGDPADTDLWAAALEALENEDEAYQLVPLSADPAVHALVKAHVVAQSDEDVGFYQVCWLPTALDETDAVVSPATTSDNLVATATVLDDTNGDPLLVTASANAKFVTNAVRAGDTFRTNYGTNAIGEETYDEYEIESVTSETSLILATGPTVEISVAVRFEVWRAYTKAELVSQLVAVAAGHASDRVRLVWPDRAGFGGETLDGYNLCAALAGLAGSVPSHQGLRGIGPVGFDDLTRSSRFFNNSQLKALADGGLVVLTQTPDARPYVLYANTTDPAAVETREEVIVRNADMIRKAVQDSWAPYVGSGNVVSSIRQQLEGALTTMVHELKATNSAAQLGPPVANVSIASLEIDPTDSTVINVELAVVGLAVPLNRIRITLPLTV